MRSKILLLPALLIGIAFVFTTPAYVFIDDEIPEITDRVARVSDLEGDVRVRRADGEEWESAAKNLPLVEGDEIVTSKFARVEVQFDSYTHLRIAEDSVVKILTLRDEGIAVSISQGTLSMRAIDFDPDRTFIEIDAPQTTISILKAGMFRVDAGMPEDPDVTITANEDGEARVYSQNSGFTLKDGRSAQVMITGEYAGEWRLSDASYREDGFGRWVAERDERMIKRLKDSHYGKYYDRDIYGAEDLNDYGEWTYLRDYGYVWRPFGTSLAGYSDWSPYRYGHWRWIPPFGWTWINDEPWGWATYHHGRWFYQNGWYWAPYGYYRYSRSWWSPALVIFDTWGSNICWYPLPYDYAYYDYNRHYRRHRDRRPRSPQPGTPGPIPTPAPTPTVPVPSNEDRRRAMHTPPLQRVPADSVVAVSKEEFGRGVRAARPVPAQSARTVLSKIPFDGDTPPILPAPNEIDKKPGTIQVEPPRGIRTMATVKTGAGSRVEGKPADVELRKSRILGDRAPLPVITRPVEPGGAPAKAERPTGAVERRIIRVPSDNKIEPRTDDRPTYTPPADAETRRTAPPLRRTIPAPEQPKQEQPRTAPVPRREEPRYERPRREEPKYQPPPQRREEPKYEPPRKEEPRPQPAPRQDPPKPAPPQKSDPPPAKSPPLDPEKPSSRKEDGR